MKILNARELNAALSHITTVDFNFMDQLEYIIDELFIARVATESDLGDYGAARARRIVEAGGLKAYRLEMSKAFCKKILYLNSRCGKKVVNGFVDINNPRVLDLMINEYQLATGVAF